MGGETDDLKLFNYQEQARKLHLKGFRDCVIFSL